MIRYPKVHHHPSEHLENQQAVAGLVIPVNNRPSPFVTWGLQNGIRPSEIQTDSNFRKFIKDSGHSTPLTQYLLSQPNALQAFQDFEKSVGR